MSKILVFGESGSGKTRSIGTLDPTSTVIIQTTDKDLSFKGSANYVKGRNWFVLTTSQDVLTAIATINSSEKRTIKNIVIDDVQYLMAYNFMDTANIKGYDKFVTLANNMFSILDPRKGIRDDLNIIFLWHDEAKAVADGGYKQKPKTIGKLLDEKITIEGLFTIVLFCNISKDKDDKLVHYFMTNSDGSNVAKSPEGMFPSKYVPNDLKYVLECVSLWKQGKEAPKLPENFNPNF